MCIKVNKIDLQKICCSCLVRSLSTCAYLQTLVKTAVVSVAHWTRLQHLHVVVCSMYGCCRNCRQQVQDDNAAATVPVKCTCRQHISRSSFVVTLHLLPCIFYMYASQVLMKMAVA